MSEPVQATPADVMAADMVRGMCRLCGDQGFELINNLCSVCQKIMSESRDVGHRQASEQRL